MFKGITYFLSGLGLIFKPKIRRFVFIPLFINVLIFSLLIYYGWQQYQQWITGLIAQLPTWLAWLEIILIPLFVIASLVVVFFTFSIVANFVSSPFNALLAEAVENRLTGEALPTSGSWQEMIKTLPSVLMTEIHKLLYYLRWVILLLLLGFIPVINLLTPFLWLVFGAWMLVLQYMDYPMGNHGIKLKQQRELLSSRIWLSLSFGGVVLIAMLIPFFNLLIMPAAIAGATQCWVTEFRAAYQASTRSCE
jgi:CysZ protein